MRWSGHEAHRPEVAGEGRLHEVGVGHGAVALHTPARAPGVAYDEALTGVIVAYRDDGVPTDHGLRRRRQRHHARLRHLLALEAVVNGEAEDHREAGGDAALDLHQVLQHALILDGPVLQRVAVALRGRLFRKLRRIVRPLALGAYALFSDALDAVADAGARVGARGALYRPLVVVDEEARGGEAGRQLLFELVELKGAGDGVGRATAELPLVVDGRTLGAQVGAARQRDQDGRWRGVEIVAVVWLVGNPTVAGGLARHSDTFLSHYLPARRSAGGPVSSTTPDTAIVRRSTV